MKDDNTEFILNVCFPYLCMDHSIQKTVKRFKDVVQKTREEDFEYLTVKDMISSHNVTLEGLMHLLSTDKILDRKEDILYILKEIEKTINDIREVVE